MCSPVLFPQLYMLNTMLSGVESPLGQLGSAGLTDTLPTACIAPASLLVGWGEEIKDLVCINTVQQ